MMGDSASNSLPQQETRKPCMAKRVSTKITASITRCKYQSSSNNSISTIDNVTFQASEAPSNLSGIENLNSGVDSSLAVSPQPYSQFILAIKISDDDKVKDWLKYLSDEIQWKVYKHLSKARITVVDSRFQTNYPHKNRKGMALEWWPEGVRRKEPDQLNRKGE
jgi:hypothetical protein